MYADMLAWVVVKWVCRVSLGFSLASGPDKKTPGRRPLLCCAQGGLPPPRLQHHIPWPCERAWTVPTVRTHIYALARCG